MCIGTVLYGDLIVKGNSTVYLKGFERLTEGPDVPTEPVENDYWRDTTTNSLYKFTNSDWQLVKKTARIKALIQSTKDIRQSETPWSNESIKQRIMNLEEALYILYKEVY